jgi:hypothetical protein
MKKQKILFCQSIVDSAKNTVQDAVQWSVCSGFGVHLLMDFWSYKHVQLLALMVTCCQKNIEGVHSKELYLAGVHDVSNVVHNKNLTLQKINDTASFLHINLDDIVSTCCDGGLCHF